MTRRQKSAAPQGTGARSPARHILFISFISLLSFIYLLYRLNLIYLLYRSLISLYILYLLYRYILVPPKPSSFFRGTVARVSSDTFETFCTTNLSKKLGFKINAGVLSGAESLRRRACRTNHRVYRHASFEKYASYRLGWRFGLSDPRQPKHVTREQRCARKSARS